MELSRSSPCARQCTSYLILIPKDCHKSGVLNPINRRTEAEIERILAAYRERPSMRGIARVFGISRNTLAKWLKKSPDAAGAAGNPPAR